jgi:phosphopantothenoylcysteine decarboxylase / phosphopantothenate---cysteine ligase
MITAGPTREYLDDVRYLSNASSGRMGYALATAALKKGHEVILVSGPVDMKPPQGCEFHSVETTSQMKEVCHDCFSRCDGVIAAAAVCDYKPVNRVEGKLAKTGNPISIDMIETDDVLAELGQTKNDHWIVGFALEAENARENALQKLRSKNCDWIILNNPSAIGSETNDVEILDSTGKVKVSFSGNKSDISTEILSWIEEQVS